MNVETKVLVSCKINFAGIGISLISKSQEEILYMSMKNVEFNYRETNLHHTFMFVVKWLQIDNQIYGTPYPILLYPSRRNSELPVLQAALVHSKDECILIFYR